MNRLLINKYYPKSINDFDLPVKIKDIIDLIIDAEQYNILLTGDTSTCKTSLIQYLVHNYYEVDNYDMCITTPSISENILLVSPIKEIGIHAFRNEVKTFCQSYCSIRNKRKIVILDDIDLLNDQIQQVIRNLFDSHSKSVFFICSCVNMSKVDETLQSRLFVLKLPNIDIIRMKLLYNRIVNVEHIDIDADAVDNIIQISNYSPSLLINYLEKFKILNKRITKELVIDMCTTINYSVYDEYFNMLYDGKLQESVRYLLSLHDQGYNVMDIYDSLFGYVKFNDKLSEHDRYNIIQIICKYIDIYYSTHDNEIELACLTNGIYMKCITK